MTTQGSYMRTTASNPLLMGCSLPALRAKLLSPQSVLFPYWEQFYTLSQQDPLWNSPYTVLAAILTEKEDDRQRARECFLRFVAQKNEGDTSLDAQMHTHVTVAPLARWAIWHDWLMDCDLFSAAENEAISEAIIDHAYTFAWPNVVSRANIFENQILSNAFCAATVGYVYGVHRGDNSLARTLLDVGFASLTEEFRRLPAGGYSSEGSAYQCSVVQPLIAMSGMLYEEISGVPVFAQGVAPSFRPLITVLQTSWKIISPAGLLAAWDHYGFSAADIKCGLVMLAKQTGDPRPLATIRDAQLWYRTSLPAWGHDDRLWSLIWWPQEIDNGAPAVSPDWMLDEVGGALQYTGQKIRLMQYWDICGGLGQAGRFHVDPNSVTFEALGSPLVLDGRIFLPKELAPMPVETIAAYTGRHVFETLQNYMRVTWGGEPTLEDAMRYGIDGNIGQANTLILDGESWYVPLHPCHGVGEALHAFDPLKVLRSAATDHYRDRYDVESVTRTSLLIDGRYAIISDQVRAASPHSITWQAYLRSPAVLSDQRVIIEAPELVQCDLVFPAEAQCVLDEIPTYPSQPDGKSIRCSCTMPPALETRIDVALIPQARSVLFDDLSDEWQRTIGGARDVVSLRTAYLSDTALFPEEGRSFKRTYSIIPKVGCRYYVEVAIAPKELKCIVNGTSVQAQVQADTGSQWISGTMLPQLFEVTGCLRLGENELELSAPFFHGESVCGPVLLKVDRPADAVAVTRVSDDNLRVTIGSKVDDILLEHHGGVVNWGGGQTDARYAVKSWDGAIAAIEVTQLALPQQLTLSANIPVSLSWTSAQTQIGKTPDGITMHLQWNDGLLLLRRSGCLFITYSGSTDHRLRVATTGTCRVFINGERYEGTLDATAGEIVIDLPPAVASDIVQPTSPAQLYALAENVGIAASPVFLNVLAGGDWKLQMAAADVIGRLRIIEAVPVLMRLFEESEAEKPYPELHRWWSWSMMLRASDRTEGVDETLEMPLAVKRWRVRCAVVIALGQLGDSSALALLEQAFARDDDFFPVLSQLAVALGRLGAASSIPILASALVHGEINTRHNAMLSHSYLTGKMTREEFEQQVGK